VIVYIGLAVVSAFLVHCAGTWAYIFFIILRDGEVTLYEPSKLIRTAEFGMAVVWTLAGIFFFVAAILSLKKKADRRRRK